MSRMQKLSGSFRPTFSGSNTKNDSGLFWLLALGVAAGIAIPLTNMLAGMQNGDGILTSLISTQKLTWYFWDQDRFLNFIPALAKPFSNVEWNLHFQVFLRAFFAFLSPIGILCLFRQSPGFLVMATALANCLMALTLNQHALFNLYAEHNPFGTSLALFALSFAILRQNDARIGRLLLSLTIGFIAYATNFALLTLSLPLLMLALLMQTPARRQLLRFLLVNVVAIGLAIWHSKHFGHGSTPFNQAKVSWGAIRSGYQSVASVMSWPSLLLLGLIALACGWRTKAPHLLSMALLMLGSIALIGALSCSIWPQMNVYHIRYYLTFVIAFVSCISYLLVASFYFVAEGKPLIQTFSATALLILEITAGLHNISSDGLQLVDRYWRTQAQDVSKVVVANHVQLVTGDFWSVWPAVFDSLALSPDSQIYGAAFRGDVLAHRIQRFAETQHGLRTLCFYDDVDMCTGQIFDSLHLVATADPGSEQKVTVDGKPMLLFTVQLPLPAQNWSTRPLTPTEARGELTVVQAPTLSPTTNNIHLTVDFKNTGPMEFTSYGKYPIHLGTQLLTTQGNVEAIDFIRTVIPNIPPNEHRLVVIDIPAARLDGHGIRILPLQEGVTWFGGATTKDVTLGPFHACTNIGQPSLCYQSGQALPSSK